MEGAESWRRAGKAGGESGSVCVGGWRCLRGRETMRGAGEEHADAWVGHRHHVHVWGPWLVSDDRPLRHRLTRVAGGRGWEGAGGAVCPGG